MSFNPYRHVASKIRRLLESESLMSAEDRQCNQWSLITMFCGTRLLVGKGDVNTMFYQLGEGERKVCFPDELLDRLTALGAQSHWRFEVVDSKGKVVKQTWTLKAAMKAEPKPGHWIIGHKDKAHKLYRYVRPMIGDPKWLKASG
jgi:hypothetical protein